jgi:hypothetical protein
LQRGILLEDLENIFTPGGVKPTTKVAGEKNVDVDIKNDHSQFFPMADHGEYKITTYVLATHFHI